MSHPLNTVISMAMKAAEQAGEFKNLPGAGKPLEFPSNSKVAVIDRLKRSAINLNHGFMAERPHH